jgi:hypothetical protein
MGYAVIRRDYGRVPSYSTWARFAWWIIDENGSIVDGFRTEREACAAAEA